MNWVSLYFEKYHPEYYQGTLIIHKAIPVGDFLRLKRLIWERRLDFTNIIVEEYGIKEESHYKGTV